MKMINLLMLIIVAFLGAGCKESMSSTKDENPGPAVVSAATFTGTDGSYTFSVTLKSPDTGCDQYANWWEVTSTDGDTLYYRRILAHSHVSEQPFTRSGGVADIQADTEVIIRAHMNSTGYGEGEIVMKGSIANGFLKFNIASGFGADLEQIDPQPGGCAF